MSSELYGGQDPIALETRAFDRYTIEARAWAYTRDGQLVVVEELGRLFNDLHRRGITSRGFSVGTGYEDALPDPRRL